MGGRFRLPVTGRRRQDALGALTLTRVMKVLLFHADASDPAKSPVIGLVGAATAVGGYPPVWLPRPDFPIQFRNIAV